MLDEEKLNQFSRELKRIFALPITRSTFRELQNACVTLAPMEAPKLFEAIISGDPEIAKPVCSCKEKIAQLIEDYSITFRVAREVFERGEFIGLATADMISQPNKVAFLNRIRRIDGEELQFITDTPGTMHLIHHLLDRLQDLHKHPVGKETLTAAKEDLKVAREKIGKLLAS